MSANARVTYRDRAGRALSLAVDGCAGCCELQTGNHKLLLAGRRRVETGPGSSGQKKLVDLRITRTIQQITSFICVRNNLRRGKKNIILFVSRV